MNIVVTGAAGFIGSHLCEALLAAGHDVTGVDQMAGVYRPFIKQDNVKKLLGHPRFRWISEDLLRLDLPELLRQADVVFHHAAIAGVRDSWGTSFESYLRANVLLTQRLLEACRETAGLKKLVYASSSSVYGGGSGRNSAEHAPTVPISPYGLTKLAGEQLCQVYNKQYGVPYTALRYFTVYGPRQRPDMGFHRWMKAALFHEPLPIYGDGEQTRDFTYVGDAVKANMAAMDYGKHGTVFNIGGVETVSVNEAVRMIEQISGRTVQRRYLPKQPGDPDATRADIRLARAELGYEPSVPLEEGMAKQWEYIAELYSSEVRS